MQALSTSDAIQHLLVLRVSSCHVSAYSGAFDGGRRSAEAIAFPFTDLLLNFDWRCAPRTRAEFDSNDGESNGQDCFKWNFLKLRTVELRFNHEVILIA